MKRGRALFTVLGLAAALDVPQALAQESGGYLGAGLGQSKFKEWCDTGGVAASFNSCQDTDTAWKLFGGYRINRYLAIEGTYIDWGEVSANGVALGAPFDVAASQSSLGIAGVASLPLAENFAVFGKLGYLRTEQETRNLTRGSTVNRHENELHYGLGLRYSVTPNWAVRGEWENTEKLKVEMLSIGVEYRF